MKFQYYIPLLVLIISCGQGRKMEKESEINTQGAVEIVEDAVADYPEKDKGFDFNKIMAKTKTKTLPHFETTNFDSFIDEGDYEEIDGEALQLEQIYPDFHRDGFDPKVIAMHKLPLSDSFVSVVATILKSENEMETLLVNFDKEGKIIAHQIAAYDEIAEGMSQVVSRISEGNLTVNHIFWGDIKKIEEVVFKILYDGKIEKIDTRNLNETFENFSLINNVLLNLNLDWIHAKTNLITTKEFPDNAYETIVVIPEIVDEGIMYFNLNSHIVIVDNNTERIKYKYFESHKTNGWESDAVRLDEIEINFAPYKITKDKGALGLKVSHFGSSRVNPYSVENLSLFVKSNDKLLKVLSDYAIKDYVGEWDGDCNGEFTGEKRTLIKSTNVTNGYFDINVIKEITYTENFEDDKGECLVTEKDEIKSALLKFNGKTYIETDVNIDADPDAETKSYSEFHPKKLEHIQIENFHISHANDMGKNKIISGLYEPKDGQLVPPDTKNDWGLRLLLLDASNKVVYASKGFGEAYMFEPNFYKSDVSNKIIIICQLAFEYPFGGEAFILENENIKHIGTLDIEGTDEEKYMTEIVEIKEIGDEIVFTLKSDEVILNPGSIDEAKINNNIQYVYKNNVLSLRVNIQ